MFSRIDTPFNGIELKGSKMGVSGFCDGPDGEWNMVYSGCETFSDWNGRSRRARIRLPETTGTLSDGRAV